MHFKLLAITTLAAAVLAGCTNEEVVKKDTAATKAAKPKPQLMMGASAQMLSVTCEGCHGTDGVSSGPAIPSIAGMSKDYLAEAMEYYVSGDTKSTIMQRIMKGYTEEEIELIAGYFASKKHVPAKQKFDHKMAMKGKKLHEKYCEECHGDGGKNVEDDTGLLAGQWIPYLQYSITDYNNGDRDIGKKMKKKLDALIAENGHEGVEALIQYYASQQ